MRIRMKAARGIWNSRMNIIILQAAVHTLIMKMTDTITEAEQVQETEAAEQVQEAETAEQAQEAETAEQVQEAETAEQVQETEQIQIRALIREAVKIRVILRSRPAAILPRADMEMAAAEMAAEHRR